MEIRMLITAAVSAAVSLGARASSAEEADYLSDMPYRIWGVRQGWGFLGVGTAWVSYATKPAPIQICDKEYKKGLGTLTNGDILVELDGEYATFRADVGMQNPGGGGAVFQVELDGKIVFDSGAVKPGESPKPVEVPVSGAREMHLLTKAAVPGELFLQVVWADARVLRSASSVRPSFNTGVDMAQFAQVVTCDPNRYDGAKSDRLEEFRAEDVFLENDLVPGPDGTYTIQPGSDGKACIGLAWNSRRRVRELSLQFPDSAEMPSPRNVKLECWTRPGEWPKESAWQGAWKPLPGNVEKVGGKLVWTDLLENPNGPSGTQKVRWVFQSVSEPIRISGPKAFTKSEWETEDVLLQLEKPQPGNRAGVYVYNGEIVTPTGPALTTEWDTSKPLRLTVRYSRPNFWKADRTVIRLSLPSGAFGVAVDDIAANECLYVKDFGLFAAKADGPTLAEYKKKIAPLKTVLEEVREMPEQTRERAMETTRKVILSREIGSTILSLPCENHKLEIARGGKIRAFLPGTDFPAVPYLNLEPTFGSGATDDLRRSLRGGWLPVQETSWKAGGNSVRQRAFAAPYGKDGTSPGNPWKGRRPLFVVDFGIRNTQDRESEVSLALPFSVELKDSPAATARRIPEGAILCAGDRALAFVAVPSGSPLKIEVSKTTITMKGTLPARSSANCTLYIPGWDALPADCTLFPAADSLLRSTEAYWRRLMVRTTQLDLPDEFLKNVIYASEVHCLIASRSANDGALVAPWIGTIDYPPFDSEAHAIIEGLDAFGHADYAQRALDFYISKYNKAGYLAYGYTLIGTGWHLWTIAEHEGLTGDTAWLKANAPKIAGVCKWVTEQREKTKKLALDGSKMPEYGLMPPGVVADWNAYGYTFAQNGYFYAGLHHAATALASIGYPGADEFLKDAEDFRKEIVRAYHLAQSQAPVLPLRNGAWVPSYPMQLTLPGLITDFYPDDNMFLTRLYDVELGAHHLAHQGVLDSNSRETDWIMSQMEDGPFLAPPPVEGGNSPQEALLREWFDLGGYASMQPAYCHNMEIDAFRGDVKPFIRSYFNAMASTLNIENLTFAEDTYAFSSMNKTHSTGEFLRWSRFMLVMDQGEELALAPCVPASWMKDGRHVGITNLPTRFGSVSYRMESHAGQGYIAASIDPPTRSTPSEIVIRLAHPDGHKICKVTVNGVTHTDFDPDKETVRIRKWDGTVTIRADY